MVNPIAISGSNIGTQEPAIEVYRAAFERGINLVFWDAHFKNMTCALLELSDEKRSELFIVTSIAFGGPGQIREGLSKRMKLLKLEKFSSYHLGWVRSKFRVRQSVLDELILLREKGLCDNIGLSIHRRKMAYELSTRGVFDIFMLRYNAAHRGLEDDFLNRLDSHNRPTVLAYTATRWRKLLERPDGWKGELARPGDFYRFSLSHKFVDAVCMSPQTPDQLEANLRVLDEGPLSDKEREEISRFGDAVHESKSSIFGDPFEQSARM